MSADAGFWNKIAAKYAKSPVRNEEAYEQTLTRVEQYLQADQQVLELGSGTCSTAIRLAPKVAHITATDLAAEMLKIGRDRASQAGVENISFQDCDTRAAPKGLFDVVMAFNLMHLIAARNDSYAAIYERLAPGGLFISKTPCLGQRPNSVKYWMFRLLVPLMKLVGKAPSTVAFMDVATLEAEIEAAGFEILETGNYPDDLPSRFVVARKR